LTILHVHDRGAEYYDERAVCLSVCLCVCLSTIISLELRMRSSSNVLYVLPIAVAWSSFGGVVISYVLPVLWMTVIFAHKPRLLYVAAQLKSSAHAALGLAMNRAQYYELQANGRTGLLFGRLK